MVTKKAKVIMLPTESSTHIYTGNDGRIYYTKVSKLRFRNEGCHLYITSDEEIKEGDWYIHNQKPNGLRVCNSSAIPMDAKKIIATTDKSLTIQHMTGQGNLYNEPLPQIPQSFIEEYCEKGGIDEVMVEYEGYKVNDMIDEATSYRPKVSLDNTIIIRPVKDSWNKEEVLNLCEDYYDTLVGNLDQTCCPMDDERQLIKNWIKENLK